MQLPRVPRDKLALRNKVFNIIKERSFSRGRFVLASGRESSYYLDMKPTMLHADGATLLAQLILKRLEGSEIHYIGGLEVGAVPLLSPIAIFSKSTARPISGFFVRKTVKDHGTKKLIEGVAEGDLKGKKVVILDDVTTTGESAMLAVKAAQDAGGEVCFVLSIVDREEGAPEFFEKAGVEFKALFRASELLHATEGPARTKAGRGPA